MTKSKKALSLLLVIALVFSVVPAFATDGLTNSEWSVTPGEGVIGDENPVDVLVTKGSTYTITIPKTIILDGSASIAKGTYAVHVEGDLSGTEYIKVVPETSFKLAQAGKGELEATVEQKKVKWSYSDLDVDASGLITADGLTAGSWTGSFKFNISRGESQTTLEGDGQTFYNYAPSTLSFRSNAPKNEFQEVTINGVTLDPTAYTISEGSTIITLNIDYLHTLDIDEHDIAVISENQISTGSFMVDDGDWNSEVGFWYNKPYVMAGFGGGLGVMFNKDGTIYGVTFDLSSNVYYIDKYPYEVKDGKVFAYVDETVFVAQGTEDENILSVYDEAAPEDLMEFWHYEKACVSEGEYFYAEPWAAWTGELVDYDAQVLDRDKEYYLPILTGVNGVVVETNGTYRDCVNLKEISIPYGITFIGDDCFENCGSLRKVTLPNSITRIYSTAFTGCTSLTKIEFHGTVAAWENITKDSGWNRDIPATEVVCSDGVVSLA